MSPFNNIWLLSESKVPRARAGTSAVQAFRVNLRRPGVDVGAIDKRGRVRQKHAIAL